jgi:hypothetical protein
VKDNQDQQGHFAGAKLAISKPILICRLVNAALMILLVAVVFLAPAAIVIHDLTDSKIRTGGIPHAAWMLHRKLSPKYANWARQRMASNRGLKLSKSDISGTEWPLFGSVFFLWATEALQDDWDENQLSFVAPKVYAKEAIEAAKELVIDPKQAGWVKQHWGENYLKHENAFYRMLVISALTSHARLTGDKQHLDLLRDQVESLSAEITASPHGLLEDYPSECYPDDVLTAIAMIRKADQVLSTDHSAFCAQAIRGFQGRLVDGWGLVPYDADARNGTVGMSRGCGNSYVSLFSPGIWPEQAKKWYELYEQHFWQERKGMAGFREFPKEIPGHDWYSDVDAGPVISGLGFAATAFGIGAARVNGRFDHAYPLTAELYAASWPLPNRTLLLPRLLSNAADAPFLGEAGILFILTRAPAEGFSVITGGSIPTVVFIGIAVQLLIGLGLVVTRIFSVRRWLRNRQNMIALLPRAQFGVWLGLLLTSLAMLLLDQVAIAIILLLFAQLFPGCRKRRLPDEPLCPP